METKIYIKNICKIKKKWRNENGKKNRKKMWAIVNLIKSPRERERPIRRLLEILLESHIGCLNIDKQICNEEQDTSAHDQMDRRLII